MGCQHLTSMGEKCVISQSLIKTENLEMPSLMHPQHSGFVDSVTFHAQRNTSGETQSAQYSIALFVASDATDTWQSCCETVTQGRVTHWSEPAVSVFRRQNKERSQCLPSFLSVLRLQPPPSPSFVTLSFGLHQQTLFSHPHTLFIHLACCHPISSFQYSHLSSPLTNRPSPPRD